MTHDINEKIFPADPRITAYAFGELEGDELARVETAVQADPELEAAVEELRAFGGELVTSLGAEKADGAHDDFRAQPAAPAEKPRRRGLRIPFPLYYLATAAAACFAVIVWMQSEAPGPRPEPMQVKRSAPPVVMTPVPPAPVGKIEPPPVVVPPAQAAVASVEVAKVAYPVEVARPGTVAEKPALVTGSLLEPMLKDESVAALAPTLSLVPKQETGLWTSGAPEVSSLAVAGYVQSAADQSERTGEASGNLVATSVVGRTYTSGEFLSRRAESRGQSMDGLTTGWQQPAGYMDATFGKPEAPAVAYVGAEAYTARTDNAYRSVAEEPLSTFSLDVDTASYANVRRFINGGHLPPRDVVRIEELINYFPYRYAPPPADAVHPEPFAAKLEIASAPWAPAHRLVRVGLKGREFTAATRPSANLVFLLDVSGSMDAPNKLPLVKASLRLLVERLRSDDRVAIVTYAGNSGLALPSTPASRKDEILASLDNLDAGGSTNGGMGIHLAYDIAKANFVSGGVNRVILCTDGDFNVGVTDQRELVSLIEEKAKSRVFLSVFGFGMGNYKDSTLEALADKGNGAYGYIDTRREAEKVFVEQAEGTLATIAKDVKIQVEFNPARVAAYRLIGYEKRMLAKEDFNNDAVDAGEVGAGHTVTALYEIVPVGVEDDGATRPTVDALKYQRTDGQRRKPTGGSSPELLTVKIRYKAPEGDVSKKQEFPLIDTGADFAKADGEFRFAAAVAAWGMLLRDSPHKGSATFDQVAGWAEDGLGNDDGGYRAEFIQLVRRSAELSAK